MFCFVSSFVFDPETAKVFNGGGPSFSNAKLNNVTLALSSVTNYQTSNQYAQRCARSRARFPSIPSNLRRRRAG